MALVTSWFVVKLGQTRLDFAADQHAVTSNFSYTNVRRATCDKLVVTHSPGILFSKFHLLVSYLDMISTKLKHGVMRYVDPVAQRMKIQPGFFTYIIPRTNQPQSARETRQKIPVKKVQALLGIIKIHYIISVGVNISERRSRKSIGYGYFFNLGNSGNPRDCLNCM